MEKQRKNKQKKKPKTVWKDSKPQNQNLIWQINWNFQIGDLKIMTSMPSAVMEKVENTKIKD